MAWSRLAIYTTIALLAVHIRWSPLVNGFPMGAGGCRGGEAAVGGFHVDATNGRPVSNNTLAAGGVVVAIDETVVRTESPLRLSTGQDHTITIESTQFPLRGALIRIEAPGAVDATDTLVPGSLMQIAAECVAPVVGTTHVDNSDKTILTSTIRFDQEMESVFVDVTAVYINAIEGSVYTYSRFVVDFATDAPTTLQTTAPGINPRPMSRQPVATRPTIDPDTVAPTTRRPSNDPTRFPESLQPSPLPLQQTGNPTTRNPTTTPTQMLESVEPTTLVSPSSVPIQTTFRPTVMATTLALSDAPSLLPTLTSSTTHPTHGLVDVNGKGKGKGSGMGKSLDHEKERKGDNETGKGKGKGKGGSNTYRGKKRKGGGSEKREKTAKGSEVIQKKSKEDTTARRMKKDLMRPRKGLSGNSILP